MQWSIIPYQEPPGNYNLNVKRGHVRQIIPYQEPPGNYNSLKPGIGADYIIPYQEPPGNYNHSSMMNINPVNYTIPRTTGELQPHFPPFLCPYNYTIPRTTGELQPVIRVRNIFNELYHTKNHRGTTTITLISFLFILYHTKNHRGTTTC